MAEPYNQPPGPMTSISGSRDIELRVIYLEAHYEHEKQARLAAELRSQDDIDWLAKRQEAIWAELDRMKRDRMAMYMRGLWLLAMTLAGALGTLVLSILKGAFPALG